MGGSLFSVEGGWRHLQKDGVHEGWFQKSQLETQDNRVFCELTPLLSLCSFQLLMYWSKVDVVFGGVRVLVRT